MARGRPEGRVVSGGVHAASRSSMMPLRAAPNANPAAGTGSRRAGSENPSLHAGGGATAACLTEAGHPAASGAAKATARMLMSMVESHREEWGCALTGRQTRRSGRGILYLFGIYSARDPRQAKDFIRNVADEFVTVLTAWGCNFLARSRADRCAERHVASRRSGRRPLS